MYAAARKYRAGRIIFTAAIVLLLLFMVVTPALLFPPYELPAAAGQYQVGTVLHTCIDGGRLEAYAHTGRNRKLNVECWYPQNGDGRYPPIFFSHGGIAT